MDPQWITALIAFATLVAAFTAFSVRWAWHILRGTQSFLDDWKGEDARPGVPARPGVMERLQTVEFIVTEVRGQVFPNGSSSLRDVVGRIEADVAHIKAEQQQEKN